MMRRAFMLGAAVALLGAAGVLWSAERRPGATMVFRAGSYAMDITPLKFPVPMNGSMTPRFAEKAHDPVQARCLVLDDGSTKIAFVVVDACMMPRDQMDAAKKRASELTGIAESRICMSATHTHTGVSLAGVFGSDAADREYLDWMVERIALGIKLAHDRLEPAQVGWAVGHEGRHVFNRRWLMAEGKTYENPFGSTGDRARMNPASASADVVHPISVIDPDVSVLAVRARNGRPIGLLANYSLHYVGGIPGASLSADYFGEFGRQMSQRLGGDSGFVAIMSNGTSGDINNTNFYTPQRPPRQPFEQIRIVAGDLADVAKTAYDEIEWRNHVPIRMAEREISLGVRKASTKDLELAKKITSDARTNSHGAFIDRHAIYAREAILLADYPDQVPLKLQAIRIGELGIATTPCETFVDIGLHIKKNSPLKTTFTISLANGYNGYLPTPEHHKLGGYETWRARSSYLEVNAAPKIQALLLEMLEEVAKDPS